MNGFIAGLVYIRTGGGPYEDPFIQLFFFFLRNIRKWATSREHIFEPIRIPDERAPADSTLGHKKRKTLKQLNVSWRRGGIKSLNIYRLLVELMMIATDKKKKRAVPLVYFVTHKRHAIFHYQTSPKVYQKYREYYIK